MKKYLSAFLTVCLLSATLLTACGTKEAEVWTVTCPWAETGVAARVNVETASKSTEVSKQFIFEPTAVKGDAKTVNEWIARCDANSKELIFSGEGMFAIAPIMSPENLEFTYDDFVFIENLYSSIFVISARADLNLNSVLDVQMYMADSPTVKVAVNGKASSESFLTYAFFGSMAHAEDVELIICNSADEAAQAVVSGEADFAVSHQSQILDAYEKGVVTVIGAFDGEDITDGPFAGVEGVGKYGFPYFRNRCFIMAPKGLTTGQIGTLKSTYGEILKNKDVIAYYDDMLIEIDPMTETDVLEHLENVRGIVEGYSVFFEE